MRPRSSFVIACALSAIGLGYAASASTLFVPDSDTATLAAILANGLKQLATLNQELGEVRNSYVAARTLVGYGADVKNGFAALVSLDANKLEQLLVAAVPNAGFFVREANGGYQTWGQGTGELQIMISACMNSKQSQLNAAVTPNPPPLLPAPPITSPYDPCAILENRLSGNELSTTLKVLFPTGVAPALALPAVTASARAAQQEVRDAIRQQKIAALSALCADAASADPDKCNAAAHAAELITSAQLAELVDRMVDLNRIEAVQLAMHVSEQAASQQRDDDRRAFLLEVAGQAAPAPLQLRAPGLQFGE
jgi:hypothetical protein